MSPLISAATLLIHIFFDAYIVILLLRFLFQKLGASWHNPISQFIIKLTEMPLKPFRKIAPGVHGFDISILLLAFIIQLIEIVLVQLIQFSIFPHLIGALIMSVAEILSKFITIYIYSIIINVIVSWIPSLQYHPISHVVFLIVDPLLSRIRTKIPPIAGLDISPVFALLLFTLVNILIVSALIGLGIRLL